MVSPMVKLFIFLFNDLVIYHLCVYVEYTEKNYACNMKRSAMQGWDRAIHTLSVRRLKPPNTNPQQEKRGREKHYETKMERAA